MFSVSAFGPLVLRDPDTTVQKLRTTAPLFKAYEEVYSRLEKLCPEFYKSEQVAIDLPLVTISATFLGDSLNSYSTSRSCWGNVRQTLTLRLRGELTGATAELFCIARCTIISICGYQNVLELGGANDQLTRAQLLDPGECSG